MTEQPLPRTRIRVLAVVSALALALAATGAARAQPACTFEQVTSTATGASSSEPEIDAAGGRVAFVSNRDLVGTNADGSRELFLWHAATTTLEQITDSPFGEDVFDHAISADGTRIAFASEGDHVPGGNLDATRDLFLYDTTTASFTQATTEPVGDVGISGDGSRIVFSSFENLSCCNADGNSEIFFYDVAGATITQNTFTGSGSNFDPRADFDASVLAFHSSSDLTGENADGNFEVFVFDNTVPAFTQLTDSSVGDSLLASISDDGTRVAFISDANLVGQNADGSNEVMLYDSTTATLIQVTDLGAAFSASAPVISRDGGRIAFHSTGDLTGGNPDGNTEIFLYDIALDAFVQVTDTTTDFSGSTSIDGTGSRIAFVSNADLTGGNVDGSNEVFVATCVLAPSVIEIPTVSGWGLALTALLLLVAAGWQLRRTRRSAAG